MSDLMIVLSPVLLPVFAAAFFIQKFIFTYAERMIFRLMPVMIASVLLPLCCIGRHIERRLAFNREYVST